QGEMEQRLLRAQVGLLGNYDAFHTGQQEQAMLLELLKSPPEFVMEGSRPNLLGMVGRLEVSLRQQVELIDHFKTTNALVMNSRRYLPLAARELKRSGNDELASLAQEASVEEIRLNTADEYDGRSLVKVSRRLRDWAESRGDDPLVKQALSLSRHVELLAQGEGDLRSLVRVILDLPTRREVEALGDTYADTISGSLRRSQQERRYLLLLGGVLPGAAGTHRLDNVA
ncbi:MAG: DAHL domain-containing protein, partial [Limisphaerales bacterium]